MTIALAPASLGWRASRRGWRASCDFESLSASQSRLAGGRLGGGQPSTLRSVRGGRSSVGRAPGCGPGGRGFESRRSPLGGRPRFAGLLSLWREPEAGCRSSRTQALVPETAWIGANRRRSPGQLPVGAWCTYRASPRFCGCCGRLESREGDRGVGLDVAARSQPPGAMCTPWVPAPGGTVRVVRSCALTARTRGDYAGFAYTGACQPAPALVCRVLWCSYAYCASAMLIGTSKLEAKVT